MIWNKQCFSEDVAGPKKGGEHLTIWMEYVGSQEGISYSLDTLYIPNWETFALFWKPLGPCLFIGLQPTAGDIEVTVPGIQLIQHDLIDNIETHSKASWFADLIQFAFTNGRQPEKNTLTQWKGATCACPNLRPQNLYKERVPFL